MQAGGSIKRPDLNLTNINGKTPTELCIRPHMKGIELLKSKLSELSIFFFTRFLSMACYREVKIPLHSDFMFTKLLFGNICVDRTKI